MRLGVVRVGVVQIVRGQQRQVEIFCEPVHLALNLALDMDAVVHDLGEKVVFAENVAKLGCGIARGLVLAEPEAGLHLAAHTTGGGDHPF